MKSLNFPLLLIFILIFHALSLKAQNDTVTVGLAGSAPFVVQDKPVPDGISVEIWQEIALSADIPYRLVKIGDVPTALDKLEKEELDIVVGPVSITSERAEKVWFTQPYYLSSLVIVSEADKGGLWQHIAPFFSVAFFIAIGVLLLVLAVVGTLIWLAERKVSPEQFPSKPLQGIPNGIWFALVTMTTVGYGDKAPQTAAGKIIAGAWMIIALISAASLIAGISSTLTVSRLSTSTIDTAKEMAGERVAVITGGPAEQFVEEHRGKVVSVASLQEAFKMLDAGKVDAITYDKPQIMYYLNENPAIEVSVSKSEYVPQGYGFAMQQYTPIGKLINTTLLQLQETDETDEIVKEWLGDQATSGTP